MLHSNYAFSECFIRLLLIKTSSANIFADKTKTHGIPTYLLAWWLYIGSPILGNKKSWIKMRIKSINKANRTNVQYQLLLLFISYNSSIPLTVS